MSSISGGRTWLSSVHQHQRRARRDGGGGTLDAHELPELQRGPAQLRQFGNKAFHIAFRQHERRRVFLLRTGGPLQQFRRSAVAQGRCKTWGYTIISIYARFKAHILTFRSRAATKTSISRYVIYCGSKNLPAREAQQPHLCVVISLVHARKVGHGRRVGAGRRRVVVVVVEERGGRRAIDGGVEALYRIWHCFGDADVCSMHS